MIVHNIEEFAMEIFGTTPDDLERSIYKYTDCGAWITWDKKGIQIGSIVEGSNKEFACDPLEFPFDTADYEKAIAWLEEETSREWHRANPDLFDIEDFIDALFTFEEKPHNLYTLKEAAIDLEEHRKTFECEDEIIDLNMIDAEDYMEAMNYCITQVWHSLKGE